MTRTSAAGLWLTVTLVIVILPVQFYAVEVSFMGVDAVEGGSPSHLCANITSLNGDMVNSSTVTTQNSSLSKNGAEAGSDYCSLFAVPLSFSESSLVGCVNISIIDDSEQESSEVFGAELAIITVNDRRKRSYSAVIKIIDNDVNISLPATVNVSEGVANGTVQVCAELSGGSSETTTTTAINATLATSESSPVSAVADTDYPIASLVVNFAARSKDGSRQCVNVAITDDNVLEVDETFTVSVIAGDHTLGNAVTIVTIIDDDDVTVSVPAMEIADRKNGMVQICAALSTAEDTERNFTIIIATSDDTAMAGFDYASISFDKVFTSGSPDGATRCVDITILATSFEELEELNFTLTLSTSDHGVILGNDVTTIVITDSGAGDVPGLRPGIIAVIVIYSLLFITMCSLCSLCMLRLCCRMQGRRRSKAELAHPVNNTDNNMIHTMETDSYCLVDGSLRSLPHNSRSLVAVSSDSDGTQRQETMSSKSAVVKDDTFSPDRS